MLRTVSDKRQTLSNIASTSYVIDTIPNSKLIINHHVEDAITVSISQICKLRHKKRKQISQHYTASKRQSCVLNSSSLSRFHMINPYTRLSFQNSQMLLFSRYSGS